MVQRGAKRRLSWIQGHPEFGFNFKAMVCHDGAFATEYHGYSTDELFFVRPSHLFTFSCHLLKTYNFLVQPRVGRPPMGPRS